MDISIKTAKSPVKKLISQSISELNSVILQTKATKLTVQPISTVQENYQTFNSLTIQVKHMVFKKQFIQKLCRLLKNTFPTISKLETFTESILAYKISLKFCFNSFTIWSEDRMDTIWLKSLDKNFSLFLAIKFTSRICFKRQ